MKEIKIFLWAPRSIVGHKPWVSCLLGNWALIANTFHHLDGPDSQISSLELAKWGLSFSVKMTGLGLPNLHYLVDSSPNTVE